MSHEIHNYVLGNLTLPAVCIGRGALTLEQDAATEAKRRRMKDVAKSPAVMTNAVTNPGVVGRGRRGRRGGGGRRKRWREEEEKEGEKMRRRMHTLDRSRYCTNILTVATS